MEPYKIMEYSKDKELYLQKRTKQLLQWDRVIDKLKLRAAKAEDKRKTDLDHHIIKIQVKKARTEVKLRQLIRASNEMWDEIKNGLEKSWLDLRKAFLKASAKSK